MRRLLIIAVAASALLALIAPPADATPPSDFTMEGFNPDEGSGDFTASGAAVDDGIMCDGGSTDYELFEVSGASANGFNLQIRKRFTCGDGSGTFLLKAQARVVFAKGVTFNWVILSGTDDYEDLHGTGSGTVDIVEGGSLDEFEGRLHSN